ncbi:MAG: hypothetical protein ABI193_09560 [Minicystis sp.]
MVPPPGDPGAPEQRARVRIDAALVSSGWVVQHRDDMNVSAGRGVAVREFKLRAGHGFADYLLFVDGKAVGVLEAKAEGFTLSGVEPQAKKYATGLPANLDPPVSPLPFLSTRSAAIFSRCSVRSLAMKAPYEKRLERRQPLLQELVQSGVQTIDRDVPQALRPPPETDGKRGRKMRCKQRMMDAAL